MTAYRPSPPVQHGAVQDLAAFRLSPGFRGRSKWVVQAWWLVQSLLFAPSPQVLFGWRRFLLRLFGARIGVKVLIRPSARVTYPWKLTIGDRAWIGDRVELYTLGPIEIGHDAVVSQDCYLCTGTHDYRDPSFPMVTGPIRIGEESWLASQVFVAPGVTVGAGAVVGVRSLVLADVPPMAKAVGQPAKVVGNRFDEPGGTGSVTGQVPGDLASQA